MKIYLSTFILVFFCLQFGQSQIQANCDGTVAPKVLLAGDSWAQFMGDDATYSPIFAAYGHADKILVTETVVPGDNENPYQGSAYAISGSEAREWADTDNYTYIQNMVTALEANPTIETVILSIGGNDVLAGKSDGGYYKDMDLDSNSGTQEELFNTIEANTFVIVDAIKAVRPNLEVLITSYEYPNFDVTEFCDEYACPKRRDLSFDPDNDLITNEELNQMILFVEAQRQAAVDVEDQVFYDNSIGLMHYVYGDGVSGPGVLPAPEQTTPYAPGGNPTLPTLRENFRPFSFFIFTFDADPIHLDLEAYEYKMRNTMDSYFSEKFRSYPDATFFSEGGANDGSVNTLAGTFDTNGIRVGDDGNTGANEWHGFLSFNTDDLPDNAVVTGASIYMNRGDASSNPFTTGRTPRLDMISGTFGNAAVELGDETATADATDVGCFHGEVGTDYDALRIDIHPSFLTHINLSGQTQFRMYFEGTNANTDYIDFFDGAEISLTSDNTSKSAKDKDNIIMREKMVEVVQEDGTVIQEMRQVMMLAHNGLAQDMGTAAPFLDISYELALPLELTTFNATAKGEQALLTWITAQEEEILGFDIERSSDAKNWEKIGFQASQGNSQQKQTYNFKDIFPLEGKNYYRLAYAASDKKMEYSEIELLEFEMEETFATVYPNPFVKDLTIEFDEVVDGEVTFILTDVLGRKVIEQTQEITSQTFNLEFSEQLSRGQYFLSIKSDIGTEVYKIIKE